MLDNKLFISSDLPAPLENDEVIQYIKKAHNGDLQARKKVIIHNIRLVLSIVLKKYNNTPYDKEELVSVGFLGLIHAIDTFDIEKKFKFSTYASVCVRYEINNFMKKERKHISNKSLNEYLKNDSEAEEFTLEDALVDESVDFVRGFEIKEHNKLIRELVDKLPDKNRDIILLYFGFNDGKRYTQDEIAKKFNIDQSYVSRLIKINVKKIKEELIELGIVDEISEKRVRNREENKMSRKSKNIYEYFNKYSKEEINEVILRLSDDEKELLYARYGNDLENPIKNDDFDKNKSNRFYGWLLPKMKSMLANSRKKENVQDTEDEISLGLSDNTADEKSQSLSIKEDLIKDDYIKILDIMKNIKFSDMLNTLSVKDAIIICLRLGYVDNKYFSTKSIADFLGVEEEEVIETTKKVLLLYKESINNFINKAVKEITTDYQYVKDGTKGDSKNIK